MSNRLLPYDTIIKAHEGDPIAIQAVLDRYAGYIRYFSNMNGYPAISLPAERNTKAMQPRFTSGRRRTQQREPGERASRTILVGREKVYEPV